MVILEVTTFSQKQRREHNAFVNAQLKTFKKNISADSWAHSVSKEFVCYLTKLNQTIQRSYHTLSCRQRMMNMRSLSLTNANHQGRACVHTFPAAPEESD